MQQRGILADAIIAPLEATGEIASAIVKVANALDAERSVVIIVENATHHALERIADDHTHGGFQVTPSGIVPAMSVAVFGAVDTGFATGVTGWVRYGVNDHLSEETLVGLSWNDPFAGKNTAGGSAYYTSGTLPLSDVPLPVPSSLYRVRTVCGAEKKGAEMRYTLERL